MADENATSETARETGKAVEGAVTQVENNSQAAIDAAKAEADRANEAAKQVAGAALASELGQHIQSTKGNLEKWRSESGVAISQTNEALAQTRAEFQEGLRKTQEQIAGVGDFLRSILQPSTPRQEAGPQGEPVEPAREKPQKDEGESPAPATRRKRRWI